MNHNTPVRWSWERPFAGSTEFLAVVRYELRPWRDHDPEAQRPWSLSISGSAFVVTSFGSGPTGWAPCVGFTPQPVLGQPSPAEVLLQSIASDLFLLVAGQPVDQWTRSMDALASWPHRRSWRGRGGVRAKVGPPRPSLGPTVVANDLQRGLETAWTVVAITVEAAGRGTLRPDAVWARLVDRVRGPMALCVPLSAGPGAEVTALG